MKEVISFILIVLAFVACFTLCAEAESKCLDLPKAVTTPTVDGKISDGEWDEADNQSLIVYNEWFDSARANVYTFAAAHETETEAKDETSALIENNDLTALKNKFFESEKTDSNKEGVPADAAKIVRGFIST